MAEKGRYYWIKLKKDFFKRHDTRIIESMPNGKEYLLFYLKLMVESVGHDGNLRFSDTIPYNEDMLSAITNTNIDIVRSAMKILISLELVEILDDQTIYMREVEMLTGSETEWAEKKRIQRQKEDTQRTLSLECPDVVRQEIRDKSKEIRDKSLESRDKSVEDNASAEKQKKHTRHKYGQYQNVLLSDEDLEKLKGEFPSEWEERIERLSGYMASTGKSYKNHLATIRNWAKSDLEKQASKRMVSNGGEHERIGEHLI